MIPPAPLDIYARNWSGEKIANDTVAARRLRQVATVFRTREQPSDLPAHGGPLSIKTVRRGATRYGFGRRSYRVTPGQLLIVPAGDTYTTTVEQPTAIVTIYLPDAYVSDAVTALLRPDAIDDTPARSPAFATHLRRDAFDLRHGIERLADTADPEFHNERLMAVAGAAAALIRDADAATARIDAARPATRRELFRRASLARYRIEAAPHLPVTLEALADHAALSRFHLLRAFVAAFGETPAQMRRRLCLRNAERLLAERRLPIGEIAHRTGFDNASAFSRAFARHAGMSPSSFRAR